MASLEQQYDNLVYAGVLGKVIGVYMGRPFEGWPKEKLEERWGFLDHYVHHDQNVPLVVPDDDISGTFTFIRALEDSEKYAETPDEFYGETWLNYLIENRSVLWWGGMGNSTEHTAYLRLKAGYKSPQSGSMSLNGKTVAEQIGGQIFIDGFGLVAPGKPELAAKLARKAAGVSHDGEAVNAAVVVAAMEAAAFEEKDMEKLLDIGVGQIPADSLIAQVHRDVRGWRREDKNWRRTYDRIKEKYGYHIYGGNCHVIPNHALMVMAWSYAPKDFHKALSIVCTAGWDTDCNAGNVGCVMALVTGLDGITEWYGYRSEMADRMIVPTADGTTAVTDCLTESRRIAAMGRKVMGWSDKKRPHWCDFAEPGSVQGFQAEPSEGGAKLRVINFSNSIYCDHLEDKQEKNQLALLCKMPLGGVLRTSMPVLALNQGGPYNVTGTSKLYPGMTIQARVNWMDDRRKSAMKEDLSYDPPEDEKNGGSDFIPTPACVSIRMFVRYLGENGAMQLAYSGEKSTEERGPWKSVLSLTIPETNGMPIVDLGFEVKGEGVGISRGIGIEEIDIQSGEFKVRNELLKIINNGIPGWITSFDYHHNAFKTDKEPVAYLGKNDGIGFAYTGNRWWKTTKIEARLTVPMAEEAGLVCHWQGLKRYLSLTRRGNQLVLARQYYGEEILASCDVDWPLEEMHLLSLSWNDRKVTASFDGQVVLQATDDKLKDGAAGFIFKKGLLGIGALTMTGNAKL